MKGEGRRKKQEKKKRRRRRRGKKEGEHKSRSNTCAAKTENCSGIVFVFRLRLSPQERRKTSGNVTVRCTCTNARPLQSLKQLNFRELDSFVHLILITLEVCARRCRFATMSNGQRYPRRRCFEEVGNIFKIDQKRMKTSERHILYIRIYTSRNPVQWSRDKNKDMTQSARGRQVEDSYAILFVSLSLSLERKNTSTKL